MSFSVWNSDRRDLRHSLVAPTAVRELDRLVGRSVDDKKPNHGGNGDGCSIANL